MGIEQIRLLKEAAKEPKPPKVYAIPKKSAKKIEQEKQLQGEEGKIKEAWFQARRPEMVGICQCGCAEPSQKKDDQYFRHSISHIFPKAKFESIAYHPLNWVERAFWGGCHSVMDDTSMDRWPNMADWFDIVAKFHILAPLLTPEERSHKFYHKLKSLVESNPIS